MLPRRAGQVRDVGDNDDDRDVHSAPIGEDDTVIPQENVGRDNMAGSGEWPDPDTPPSGSAPGDDLDELREREREA